jgi:hypothetical protein
VNALFVFRTSPDIDHMVPLAWKLIENGEQVHAVMSPGYDPDGDYRIEFARRYPAFHLHEARGGRLRRWARGTLPYAFVLLRRERVELVAVEWGYGLDAGYDRPRSARGVVALLRSLGRSLLRSSDPHQTRVNYLVAAHVLGLPTVCLPHGLNIKHGAAWNQELIDILAQGGVDFRDRNRFTSYVLNTEEMRRWYIDYAMGDPDVLETLGSLRWTPEWFERNLELAPPFEWPETARGRVKVVFMVPKWMNRVHADAAIELVRRLEHVDEISLAIMGHPRKTHGGADPLYANAEIDWSRIHDVTGVNSVSVIRACDVVIDVGSSIGIEVLMQGKVLVNPTYVHDVETLFDTIPGSSIVARDADAVVAYLEAHFGGRPYVTPEEAYRRLLREAVFASRADPFDVLDAHYRRLRELVGEVETESRVPAGAAT